MMFSFKKNLNLLKLQRLDVIFMCQMNNSIETNEAPGGEGSGVQPLCQIDVSLPGGSTDIKQHLRATYFFVY